MRRIPRHEKILLECVELDRVHLGDIAKDSPHLLFVPCRNGLDGNRNPLDGSTDEIHEVGDFVRTVNDGRSGEGDHFAVNCVVEALVEFARELRFVDDSGDEVMDLINDDHATRIRVRTIRRDILA